ncbi:MULTISPECIES: alpha/beta hydrolase [unclassified Pseudovibrio]|uniref:alpha/beta fold hydrolase n=1 Tax=unclassified Pseudovibrio TaxID=2627060 RepID=UPI0007AE8CA8|nr:MULTISPECIES: alpha/beta hydrolase [unclassified Pseudovibrio]KZK99850.1 Alpha/beta hydrolase family protein [Pseudovibrio sp. W74]KZL03943.1 Alpha/beta hydrolase family protein [Pseudovibrio sp. Ad14]
MKLQEGTIILPGDRALAWSEWGDAEGLPVIVCQGAGMASAIPFGEQTAKDLGLRVLSVDRPGLGKSGADPEKNFESWAEDIKELLDFVKADQAFAIGFSQGAPFALALAASGLVDGVAIVSGQDELASPGMFAKLPDELKGMVSLACDDPDRLEADIAGMATAEWLWQMIEGMSGEEDRAFYASASFAPLYRDALASGFAQGAAGYARDTRLAMGRWSFNVENIKQDVQLWYGLKDTSPVHSPDFGSTLATRLSCSELHQIAAEGSAILWTQADAILSRLVKCKG